jgi:hypothetical protein
MPIRNYTTGVSPERSATEITRALVKAGARGIAQEYDDTGHTIALEFAVPMAGAMLHYSLPVRSSEVHKVLQRQRVESRYQTVEHAERVTWRILRDWVLAQLAVIETGMVDLSEVMFPYMRTDTGDTAYARWLSQRMIEG